MCFVCDRQGRTFELIKPFLKEGVQIQFKNFDQWQEIWIADGTNDLLITADGDEGGYFHFKEEKPDDWGEYAEPLPEPDLVNGSSGGGFSFYLSSDLTINKIKELLPGVEMIRHGDKTNYEWHFSYKGNSCGIWDYHGRRWTASGKKECFEELGFGEFILETL